MERLTEDYRENVRDLSLRLAAGESFDLIERRLPVGGDELTLFFMDGFVKDGALQRLMQFFRGRSGLGRRAILPVRGFPTATWRWSRTLNG